VILTPDRRSTYTLAEDLDKEMATAGAIAAIAGAKQPYEEGEFVLLQAPNTQSVNAVYPDEPGWVSEVPAKSFGKDGLYVLFHTTDRAALVAAALGRNTPWTELS